MSSKKISGAEIVIRCLINENVDILFGYPGGAIMPVYDEFYKFQNDINHILTNLILTISNPFPKVMSLGGANNFWQ